MSKPSINQMKFRICKKALFQVGDLIHLKVDEKSSPRAPKWLRDLGYTHALIIQSRLNLSGRESYQIQWIGQKPDTYPRGNWYDFLELNEWFNRDST